MISIYIIIVTILTSTTLSQDRATLFNTGTPEDVTVGHIISSNQSIANKFYTNDYYVLETLIFSMSIVSESANLIISIREDDNGIPGELVDELSSWNYSLDPNNQSETGNNFISTTNLCIYLDAGNAYWWCLCQCGKTRDERKFHKDHQILLIKFQKKP